MRTSLRQAVLDSSRLGLLSLLHDRRLRELVPDQRSHLRCGEDGHRRDVRRLGHLDELVHDRQLVNPLQVLLHHDHRVPELLVGVTGQRHREIVETFPRLVAAACMVQTTLEDRRIALAVVLTTLSHTIDLGNVTAAFEQPKVQRLAVLGMQDDDFVTAGDGIVVHQAAERSDQVLLNHALQLSDTAAVLHGGVEQERLGGRFHVDFERLARLQSRFHALVQNRQLRVDDAEQVFTGVLLEHDDRVQAVAELFLVEHPHFLWRRWPRSRPEWPCDHD